MWASHLLSFSSNLCVLSKKSLSSMFRTDIGVAYSGGIFSLSELAFVGSLKSLVLYSNSGIGNHGHESEVMLGDIESNLHLGLFSSLSDHLSQGLYFSILFSWSSFKVCLQCLVLTFKTNSTISIWRSQVKNPCLKSQCEFSDLAIFK